MARHKIAAWDLSIQGASRISAIAVRQDRRRNGTHIRIEDAVADVVGGSARAVTGVPDQRRGERLALLYTDSDLAPRELWRHLSQTNLPALWLPKREDIFMVASLPLLGTGKLDLLRHQGAGSSGSSSGATRRRIKRPGNLHPTEQWC